MHPFSPARERGQSTVEYAVCTVGVVGLASALVHLAGSDWFRELIERILRLAYHLHEFPTPGLLS